MSGAGQKAAKTEVDYSAGKPGERCGDCVHFNEGGSCDLVAGQISSRMWCRLFQRLRQ